MSDKVFIDQSRAGGFRATREEAALAKPLVRSRVPEMADIVIAALKEIDTPHPASESVAAIIRQRCENVRNSFRKSRIISRCGKYISSRKGTTHGYFAESIILPGESAERFHKLHASYIDQFQPATIYEHDLVETMTVNRWRLRRVWCLETANYEHEVRAQAFVTHGEDPATRSALAHRALSHRPRSLESLNRYEVRCDRQYNRAADRLRQLVAERKRKNANSNPIDRTESA